MVRIMLESTCENENINDIKNEINDVNFKILGLNIDSETQEKCSLLCNELSSKLNQAKTKSMYDYLLNLDKIELRNKIHTLGSFSSVNISFKCYGIIVNANIFTEEELSNLISFFKVYPRIEGVEGDTDTRLIFGSGQLKCVVYSPKDNGGLN